LQQTHSLNIPTILTAIRSNGETEDPTIELLSRNWGVGTFRRALLSAGSANHRDSESGIWERSSLGGRTAGETERKGFGDIWNDKKDAINLFAKPVDLDSTITRTETASKTFTHLFAVSKEAELLEIASRETKTREYWDAYHQKRGTEPRGRQAFTREDKVRHMLGFEKIICNECGQDKTDGKLFHKLGDKILCAPCARRPAGW
jgi:hypothetical protein